MTQPTGFFGGRLCSK